uniref:DP-Gal:betaGlcNAc beta 1,4- galactosyltransferase, polypeptide 1, like n=1 Tax=Oryzias sinensis TaxID=183150 RepID=A0A8C7XG98_9TELE
MPADSSVNFSLLHRTCKLVVLLCFLHISVTIFFYVRTNSVQAPVIKNRTVNPVVVTEGQKSAETPAKSLEKCPETSPILVGPLRIEFSDPVSLEQIKSENPNVQQGGRFKPKDCVALQKVAIIIPFRNRDEHLKYWLYYLHPILQRQQLDYGVYVINQAFLIIHNGCCGGAAGTRPLLVAAAVNVSFFFSSFCCSTLCLCRLSPPGVRESENLQDGDVTFNRAKLLNVGYTEALKEYDYDCFVFSDVDLIPMDDRNTYKCFSQPRHLSVSMDKFGFR